MTISADTLVRGQQFEGATGEMNGEKLEDLLTRATLANGSELLDQATLETFLDEVLAVYRARVKAGSITRAHQAAEARIPTGCVMAFAMETAPTGWLECDGAAVSRTTYADLFAAIGEQWGEGDNSTTFNLPDLRGAFLRGWNHGKPSGIFDPNADARTPATGGTAGDHVGTAQTGQNMAHTHTVIGSSGSPTAYLSSSVWAPGAVAAGVASGAASPAGGTETRPGNKSVMYAIKI